MLIRKYKMLKFLEIFLILMFYKHPTNAASERLLKINTDLTASVIGAAAGPVTDDNKQPIVDVKNQNLLTPQMKTANSSDNTHICTREETYVEHLKVPSMQPVRIRSSNWCLEFPPRCSNYKTEMREVVQVQNITKTRTIRFCCAGYEGNISINDTVCKPVCRGGCGRGFCQTPDICSCEAGYVGKHCTQRCDHDRWGIECKNECQCQNGALCDNKSGICHCVAGWTGDFCELPCPLGTHGVMCHKSCECSKKRCHPQTGECDEAATNVIETLNSTIVNITHNLNQIAKKIGNIATTVSPAFTEIPALHAEELLTPKSLPEVIVIKQDEPHTPKIIVHQQGAGLLEGLHSAAKTPDVIHVITGASNEHKLELGSFAGIGVGGVNTKLDIGAPLATATPANTAAEHDANLLTTLLIILLIIIIAIAVSFLYVYRRYHWQRERVEAAIAARSNSNATIPVTNPNTEVHLSESGLSKNYLKPLPDLPAFTQMVRNKIEGPVYYDSPTNNSSVNASAISTYDYARKLSLYSIVSPKPRKGSPDSHLYDEIRYPSAYHHQHSQHAQHSQHPPPGHLAQPLTQHSSSSYITHQPPYGGAPAPVQHHISQLIIPPQNSNYLQVPQMSHSMRKVAHL